MFDSTIPTQVYEAAKRAALAEVPGKVFIGASPEFDKTGFESSLRGAFIDIYLEFLPRPIVTDSNNVIVSPIAVAIKRKKK